jgi:translation initiation factor 2 beta subunit (eIF-2beta)/eIF-5
MTTTIGTGIQDPFYRYKMPLALLEVVKQRTSFVNANDVAKSLHINSQFLCSYLKIKLSRQIKLNEDIIDINGTIEADVIQKLIEQLVDKYVLCPICRLPELRYKKSANIQIDCDACGHTGCIVSHKENKDFFV